MGNKAFLRGFGAWLPERVVNNEEIAARVGKTADWIANACGIQERRWASPETSVADMAVSAAEKCLETCAIGATQIGMIIVGSGSAPAGFPGPAAEVAQRLGLEGIPALDVPMASAGSLFGLGIAAKMAQVYGEILVIGAEKMSVVVELTVEKLKESGDPALDPSTGILFGDGAGAALVSGAGGRWEILDTVLHSDGAFRESLSFDWNSPLRMNGLSVILQAARKIPNSIQEVLARQGIAASEVAAFLMHQANQNLIVRVAKSLDVPSGRFYSNIDRYGNTSSASMLIAAAEWAAGLVSGELSQGYPVVFAAFGAGFHWGAMVARGV